MAQEGKPTMQDLSASGSVIARAFARLRPPAGAFDAEGDWTHVYHDVSTFNVKQVQGGLTVHHLAGGHLQIENYRQCSSGFRSYTSAELECADSAWREPTSWTVTSKVAKSADGAAHLQSGITKKLSVEGGVLTLQTGGGRTTRTVPGRYTCKWCLLDMVGRLPRREADRIEFTLLDEYDEPCPGQEVRFRGKAAATTRSGPVEVWCYQHTGVATMPGMFYVDAAGRVLFYLAGMQLLALACAGDEDTGYLS